MRTIIAGSRTISSYALICEAVKRSGFTITEVVCGGARGVDLAGKMWAEANNVPVKMFLADWDRFGKSAGYRRNEEMARNADALIAVWDGESKGTRHMMDIAGRAGLRVSVYMVPKPGNPGQPQQHQPALE